MKFFLGVLALACSFLFTAAPASAKVCTSNCFPAGETNYTLQHGGLTRTYRVHMPKNYDGSKATPLMLVLHGDGGSGVESPDGLGYDAYSDLHGYIAIYPDGYNGNWNGSNCCVPADAVYRDDVAFLKTVIAQAKAKANVDSNRVYMLGGSAGAAMAHRFGCEAADQVKAIIADAQRLNTPEACNPSRPVNMLEIEGLLDPLVDYFGLNTLGFVSAQQSFASWATINRCQGDVVVGRIERASGDPIGMLTNQPLPALPISVSRSETFTNCAGGVRVTLVTIVTGTHTPDINLEGFKVPVYVWNWLQQLS